MIQQRNPVSNGGTGRWHSPERDLAYCWQGIVRSALDNLAQERWEEFAARYFEGYGLTEEQIGQAAVVYAKAMGNFVDIKFKSPREAMEEAGWFALPPAAQMALLHKLGQTATCVFFTCIRDVSIVGEVPPLTAEMIYASGLQAQSQLRDRKTSRLSRLLGWIRG